MPQGYICRGCISRSRRTVVTLRENRETRSPECPQCGGTRDNAPLETFGPENIAALQVNGYSVVEERALSWSTYATPETPTPPPARTQPAVPEGRTLRLVDEKDTPPAPPLPPADDEPPRRKLRFVEER